MQDHLTLGHYKVAEGSKVHMVLRLVNMWNVVVDSREVRVFPMDFVERVKERMGAMQTDSLWHEGRRLEEGKSLEESGVKDGDRIQIQEGGREERM